jgi:hypothetical protein
MISGDFAHVIWSRASKYAVVKQARAALLAVHYKKVGHLAIAKRLNGVCVWPWPCFNNRDLKCSSTRFTLEFADI